MKRKSREKEEQEIRRYTLLQNYGYAFRWLKRVSGMRAFAVAGGNILIEIVVPFLAMALPGAVAAFFTSGRKPAEILFFVLLYAGVLQAARIAQSWFKQERLKHFFLFRINCGIDFYRKCLEADYQFFESTTGQKKMTAAEENLFSGNDVGVEAFLTAFVNAAISFGGLWIYAVLIGIKSVGKLILLLVLTIVVAYANYRAGENSYSVMENYYRKQQDFTYLKNETIASANGKDIRLYRMKQWFLGAFQTVQNQLVGLRSQELNGYFMAGMLEKGLAFLRDLVIYGYLIAQMIQGNMNLSIFLLYTGIVSGFGNWMTGLFTAVSQMLQNHVRMSQYRDFMESGILDEEEKEIGILPAAGEKHEIRLEHVSFRYEGAKEDTIRDLSLTICPGEKLALVGMNGAGKTTLIKLICGLYRPSSGRIYLDGQDVTAFSREDYWKEFAVVFQDVFAFSFSLEDNVSCVEPGRMDQKRLEECLRKADLWEKVVGLSKGTKTMMNKDLDEAGVTLSGGELQKLMLARALYKDAPVIILDEPTAALDPIAESEMYEKYYDMTREKTSIFISHRLSSTRFCDRILFMENGKILEEGTHEKLMEQQGAYAHMFEVQAHYYQKKKEEEACYA